ncbi:MAG: chemotaxis protein [Tardiphaga sp.]|uniref:methyl-accepting chemotaxis protein n=1 Tax=Tardiphaga sp. TaxID=1926292 RepID=UPI00262E5561|nr:methyl-accepting chemotaxis protein [Tardiphaga sp.]MDB5501107.1 chemotaxis protein [Tardiphaga sp.]
MTRIGFHFRVGSLLTGAFVGLTAVLVVLLGLQLAKDWRDMAAAGRLVTLAEADRTLFNSMQVLRNSRGEAQTALLNLDEPLGKLTELRERGAAKLKEAVAVLPRIGGVALDGLVVDIGNRWSDSVQKWQALDAAAAKPRASRSVADTDAWYKSMSGVLEKLNDASLNVAAEARIADPYVAELVGVRQTAWSLREAAGAECSTLRPAVAANEGLSSTHLAAMGRMRGAGEAGWSSLKGVLVRPGMSPQLADVVATAEREYTTSVTKRDDVYRTLGKGSQPIAPAQWTSLCNAPFESILAIALKALDLMQQRAEAQHAAAQLGLIVTIAATMLALSGAALILRLIRRRVIQPVRALSEAIGHLSRHEYDAAVPQVGQDDEFSAMAETLEDLRQGTIKSQLANAERQAAQAADVERATRLGALCREFEASVGRTLDTVAQANRQMVVAADAMTETATDATRQTDEIARAVRQAAEGINSVAGASEEMRASLAEVSMKVEQSSRLSAHAVSDAAETNREVARLAGAATEIGQVVGVISAIAAQTNLLALNATIEAARAGEAGRGFAIVAGEVKSLASQTATATNQITLQVSAIQGATDSAVLAMDAIGARIREVDGLTGAITQAVQGQVSAMNQVSRDSQEVALLTDRVSSQLGDVRTAAAGTVTAAGQVRQTTDELGRQSGLLSLEIERFIAGIG